MATKNKMLLAAAGNAGGGAGDNVEDVFSTYLYKGNASTQTITNDIDLAGKGGMVWTKVRDSSTYSNQIQDTVIGTSKRRWTNLENADAGSTTDITSFNSDGYTLGSNNTVNRSGNDIASWTFRKAPKFFDVVTYTGTGSVQTISHNLGAEVGCIMVKNLDSAEGWQVYHRGIGKNKFFLMTDQAFFTASSRWNNTAPTSTEFTVNTDEGVNELGSTHVAYLFAHNDGDGNFGPDGDQDIIKCGSWTQSGDTEVDLGFEPQLILVKDNGGGWWTLWDSMRGMGDSTNGSKYLAPHLTNAEAQNEAFALTPTGFIARQFNSNSLCCYIAIRRGMKVPESGTEVFAVDDRSSSNPSFTSGFPVDWAINRDLGGTAGWYLTTRLTADQLLRTHENSAELAGGAPWGASDYMDGHNDLSGSNANYYSWMWKRASKFFDVVTYRGNGSVRTEKHKLGVAPEMFIVKSRSEGFVEDWRTYHKDLTSADYYLQLSSTAGEIVGNTTWNQTAPTADVFTIGSGSTVNKSGNKYIAYLFASLDGISKVGSYTGNGTSQTIDCGFTTGARFILIKQVTVTSTGMDWYVYDTERGIVVGSDKRASLNTTAAQITVDDVYPDTSGFGVTGTNTPNTNGETYIFYAIA